MPVDPHAFADSAVTLTGGARIGLANATWPFARLTLDAAWAHLRVPVLANIWISRSSLELVYVVRGLASSGIAFASDDGTYNRIVFWTFNSAETLDAFARADWPVESRA